MTATPQTMPALPRTLVRSVVDRLDTRTSSVDAPHWTPAHQQMLLPPSTLETPSVHYDRPEQTIRFQTCEEERQLWLDLLPQIEADLSRIDRYRSCGAYAEVRTDDATGLPYLSANTCKLRICPACRRNLQRRTAARVMDYVRQQPDAQWQMHTYTLRHADMPLGQQLDRLVQCFRRLRHRKIWRDRCGAGYGVIEITYHPAGSYSPSGRQRTTDEWHPHLHCVVQVSWLDWSALHRAWREITTDSTQIDCRHVRSMTDVARYIAKYIGKPPTLRFGSNLDRATEYYHAIAHRRLLMPFGPASRHTLPKVEDRPGSTYMCKLTDLWTAALGGCWPAQCTIARLALAMCPQPKRPPRTADALLPFG